MNQYKTGDTVWTRKRGKGTITDHSHYTTQDRPFRVRFESDRSFRSPRLSSLYPSEDAIKKARWYVSEFTHSPRVATNKEIRGWREMLKGIRPVKIHISLIDYPAPKFKVGDAVYYNPILASQGHKWTIYTVEPNGTYCIRNEHRLIYPYVPESNLRLWKETVLTHCLQSDGVTWSDGGPNGWKTEWYQKIEHLPNYTSPALFKVTMKSGKECIFRGIKGDDI